MSGPPIADVHMDSGHEAHHDVRNSTYCMRSHSRQTTLSPAFAGRWWRARLSPSLHGFTFDAWARTISIIGSTGLVENIVLDNAPETGSHQALRDQLERLRAWRKEA